MAAPALRYAEMARVLASRGHQVTLAVHNDPEIRLDQVAQLHDESPELLRAMDESDIVVVGGGPYPETAANRPPERTPRAVDMTFPLLLEALAMHRVDAGSWPQTRLDSFAQTMTARLLAADVILCGSAEQRHFYLGWLAALGRLSAGLIERDPAADGLVRVVPFGCPSVAPNNSGRGPRRVVEGIGAADYVLLWSGNVSDWYDPETAVRAVMQASRRIEGLRLVFIGANVRDERLGRTPTGLRVSKLAEQLDPAGRHVFFWDDWVPYEQRADWLLEADAAVIASPRTIEADLAVRARFLDYVWCALPLITTSGGTFADRVRRGGLGIVVEPGDVDAMTEAIVVMGDPSVREHMRDRLRRSRPDHEWARALAPLLDFCDSPATAPDRGEWPSLRSDSEAGVVKARTFGLPELVGRAAARLRGAAGRLA